MSLAVAMTKIGSVFPASRSGRSDHARVVPPSLMLELPSPASPFSISSIHSTAGAIDSAMVIAWRMFSSEAPTIPRTVGPYRASGAAAATALPLLGGEALAASLDADNQDALRPGSPKVRARSPKACPRAISQSFRRSRPPTFFKDSLAG